MKHTLAFLVLFVFVLSASSQVQNVDSLKNVLNTKKLNDNEKIALLWDISKLYSSNNYDSCILYSHKGLSFAKKANNKIRLLTFNDLIGTSYFLKNSFDTSYIYLNKALEIAVDLEDNVLKSKAYSNMGTMYKLKGDFETAVDCYMKSLALNDSIDRVRATVLVNLGSVHQSLNHLGRAEQYLNEALDISKELKLEYVEMGASHALGCVYSDKVELYKARELFKKVLQMSSKLNDKQYEILSNMSLATNYAETKDYDIAIKYGNEALRILDNLGIVDAGLYTTLSEVFRKSKRYRESEKMALKAWSIDSTTVDMGAYNALNLALTNIHLGNKEKAEYFVLKFKKTMSEGNDKQMSESLANMEVKYETEKKELRIASLEKERQLYIWLAITGALLVLALGILLRQRIKNEQKKRQLAAANALQEGEIGERERLASELHDRLGGTLSAAKSELKNTKDILSVNDKLDVCIEEVRRITQNMMPLSLRFGLKAALEDFTAQFSNVKFHFFGEETTVNKRLEFVIYCCANELVTNSIRHSGAEEINVQLVQEENRIALTVQDNGHGFDKETAKKGIGLKNVNDRVASCNGKIEIASTINKGTETTIEFRPEKV